MTVNVENINKEDGEKESNGLAPEAASTVRAVTDTVANLAGELGSEPSPSSITLLPCPFCGGPARAPVHYNGAWETGCDGDHDCPGTDVLVPLKLWNIRADLWRPIEAAPKDATPFLIWQPGRAETDRIMVAYRFAPSSRTDEILSLPGLWQMRGATHWMPLPEPPPADGALGRQSQDASPASVLNEKS
jgi:hypothetical protein